MDLRDAQIQAVVGGYNLQWEDLAISASVRQVKEDGRGIRAEFRISTQRFGYAELLYRNYVSLLSPNSKGAVAKDLERRFPLRDTEDTVPLWPERIEYIADLIVTAHRKGQPVELLVDRPVREKAAYRIKPFLPEMVPTVIFGRGGSGKSNWALTLALLVASGEARLGLEVQQGNVLYCDYETCFDDLNERRMALQLGLELPKTEFHYRRCEMPLVRETERIAKLIQDYAVELLVLDSVGLSLAGSANDDQVINQYFTALRSLRTTLLLVDHLPKVTDGKFPFGSVYKHNSARSTWRLVGKHRLGEDILDIGLTHVKVNEGAPFKPLAYQFAFTNNEHNRVTWTEVKRTEMKQAFFEDMGELDRIKEVLGEEGKIRYKELALATGLTAKTTSVYLSRLKRAGKVIQLGAGYWGLSTPEGAEIAF